MQLRFTVLVKSGPREIACITAERPIDAAHLSVQDLHEQVIDTERFLERITNYRWHIEVESIATPYPTSKEK